MNPVAELRMLTGLTRTELAAMAGVPSSTVSRIERGLVSPTTATLTQLVEAAGFGLRQSIVSIADVSAIAAARGLIDPDTGLAQFPGARTWLRRWQAAKIVSPTGFASRRVCELAGSAGFLAARSGTRTFKAVPGGAREIAMMCRAAGVRYAVSGSAALNAISLTGSEVWTIVYVDDPTMAGEALGLSPAPDDGVSYRVTLLPFDGVTDVGTVVDASGVTWVDPLQAIIDGFAGGDRMPEQAAMICDLFDLREAS